jgi:hypothetical protein
MTTFKRFDARAYVGGLADVPGEPPRRDISNLSNISNQPQPSAAANADPLAGYRAVMSILLRRWVALGRPPLTLPRRRLTGERQPCRCYVVRDLGRWFLDCREDLPGTRWAMRPAEELTALARELARLERAARPTPQYAATVGERTEQNEQNGPPCADCERAPDGPQWARCRVCLNTLPGVPRTEEG